MWIYVMEYCFVPQSSETLHWTNWSHGVDSELCSQQVDHCITTMHQRCDIKNIWDVSLTSLCE